MILTAMFFLIYMMVANVSLEAYGKHANNGGPGRSKRDPDIEKELELIFAQGPTIKLLSNNITHTIVNSPHAPREAVHLDVDCRNNIVFWAVNGGGSIYRAKWNRPSESSESSESPQKGILWASNIIVGGLAYDWIQETLYWTNTARKEISMKKQAGSVIVYYTQLEPGKLVLDPLAGYLFWVENYASFDYVESRIVRAPLKEDKSKKLIRYILESLPNVNSLTLDFDNHLIYWIQLGDNKIRSTDYHGYLGRTHSHYTDNRLLLSIAIFQDWIYWSQLDKVFSIYKMYTRFDKTIKNIRNTTWGWLDPEGGYGAIQICHKLKQKMSGTDYIDVWPGLNDTIENELKKPDLIFAQGTKIKQISLANKITTRTLVIPNVPHREITHLDVDCEYNRVFYIASGGTSIYMGHWSKEQILIPSPEEFLINSTLIGGVAYNWINNCIYWTDSKLKTIRKANSKGKEVEVLYHLDLQPVEIVLVPQSRMEYILWSENYFVNSDAVSNIVKAPMYKSEDREGTITELLVGITRVRSLTFDYKRERIYWAQISDGKIRSMNLTGTDRAIKTDVQLEDPKYRLLLSIAYFQDWLYWTEFDNVYSMYKKNTKDGRIEKIMNTKRGWLELEGGYGPIQICHVLRQEPEDHTAN